MSDPSQSRSRHVPVKKEIIEGPHASVSKGIPQMKPLFAQSLAQLYSEKRMSGLGQSSGDQSQVRPVKKEVSSGLCEFPRQQTMEYHLHLENQDHQLDQILEDAELKEDKIDYISSELFFDVVICKSHLLQMQLPVPVTKKLPCATVTAILRYSRKNWSVIYRGGNDYSAKSFEPAGWKAFVKDNELKIGDACVFEVMENSSTRIRFKVHILRYELPDELQKKEHFSGFSSDNPITID